MTYRTFLSPQELLRKLTHRYDNFGRMQDNRKKYSRNAFSLIVRVLDDIWLVGLVNVRMEESILHIFHVLLSCIEITEDDENSI